MEDLISRKTAIDALKDRYYKYDRFAKLEELVWAINTVPSALPEVTLESAIDYLRSIGWLQEHDRILSESAQPEITHCAKCIHWKHSAARKRYCEVFDWMSKAEDFCSFAEGRTKNADVNT